MPAADKIVPFFIAKEPLAISLPAKRTFLPQIKSGSNTSNMPSRTDAFSCIKTVSNPSGTGAPVKIRTAWYGAGLGPASAAPAATSPTISIFPNSSYPRHENAYPSIADCAKPGISMGEKISSAKHLPNPSINFTSTASNCKTLSAINPLASATEIIFFIKFNAS